MSEPRFTPNESLSAVFARLDWLKSLRPYEKQAIESALARARGEREWR